GEGVRRGGGRRGGGRRGGAARPALGAGGGAGGIDPPRPGWGGCARRRGGRPPADQRVERQILRARLADRDAPARARLIGCPHGRGGDLLVDDGLRLGVVDAEIELVGGGAPIEWRDDDPGE